MTTFPDVPLAPGVPPLPRSPTAIAAAVVLLTEDAFGLFQGVGITQWGIFQNGLPVILADNVVAVEFKQDWTISNYPLEGGAFETYDKVQLPFEIHLQFSTGGSISDRQSFLNSIAAVVGNTQLYDVLTPEQLYQNVNLKHWDYDRRASNVGLLTVDIWVEQINQTASQSFQNVQNPASASPVAAGSVSPNTPTQAQLTALGQMMGR